MGWFDEQIKNRMQNDQDAFAQSFADMSAVIMGKRVVADAQDDRARAVSAMGDILKYYKVKPEELPESLTEPNEQLEYLLRPSGSCAGR